MSDEMDLARLRSDMDRCKHGRHEKDHCLGCDHDGRADNPGNLFLDARVGSTLMGEPITGRQLLDAHDALVARCKAAEAKVARHGPCVCNTGPGTEGPDEFCPHHGRTYNDALDMMGRIVTEERAARAKAWDEGKRAGIEQMRPTNPYRALASETSEG